MARRLDGGGELTVVAWQLAFAEPAAPLRLDGLEVGSDGALRLARLPAAAGELDVDLTATLGELAGMATDAAGNVYLTDPESHRVLRLDCDDVARPLRCLTGLRTPRGVLAGPRAALYVADSGNDRIVVVDLATEQVRDIWTGFDEPWDLAGDDACRIYVVEHGAGRVTRLDPEGRRDEGFSERMEAGPPEAPAQAIVAELGGEERLVVLDQPAGGPGRLLVYRLDGSPDAELTAAWAALLEPLVAGALSAAAAGDGVLYVADLAGGRLLAFGLDGSFRGAVRDPGAAAGLALDGRGRLLLAPAEGGAVRRLEAGTGFAGSGSFVLGPLPLGHPEAGWSRLRAVAEELAEGAHLRLFTSSSTAADREPGLPGEGDADWLAGPADAPDLLVPEPAGDLLWLGGRLTSDDGLASPELTALSVEVASDGWLSLLPAVYSKDDTGRELLRELLALYESALRDQERLIDGLPRLFDAYAAPALPSWSSWLDWLGRWVVAELEESWSPERRRDVVAAAFDRHGRRGTVEGIRELAELATGTPIHIGEPARQASLWRLDGERSVLGFSTMLAPGPAQGAVLGRTAVTGRSDIIEDKDAGTPLFGDIAHRFCVAAYASELGRPETRAALERVLDREKPAHTAYQLCPIEARMRVGFQGRVGIDAIVGPEDPARRTARIGGQVGAARVGLETTLT